MQDLPIEEIQKQLRDMIQLDYILPEDIPNIEIYMDQMTTFMEQQLSLNKRINEDKTMTKTMINNYTKNNLLPPSVKKKYSRDHVILLIFIYYMKNILSISDIDTLLTPLKEQYFNKEQKASDNDSDIDLYTIYKEIFRLEQMHYQTSKQELFETYKLANSVFPASEDDYLNDLALISLLSYDIYSKTRLIQQLIDEMDKKSE